MQIDLTGKVAAVTGGTGILCSHMARVLAEHRAAVAILGRRTEVANSIAAEIEAAGGKAAGVECDVLKVDSVEKANEEIEKRLGPVDILVNGAGGNHPGGTTSREYLDGGDLDAAVENVRTFYNLDLEGIELVFDLNFVGTLVPSRVFTRRMVKKQKGVIINISSMTAFNPLTKVPAYSAAKAAVNNFTRWLAVHMSKVGIRVNAIAPGFFITEQNRSLLANEDGSLTERGKKIISHTPMDKFGDPADLAGALLWLACDDASGFVTGAVIPVDGGFSAFSGV